MDRWKHGEEPSDQRQCRKSPLRAQEGSCFFLGSWNMVGVPMARGPGKGRLGSFSLKLLALGVSRPQLPPPPGRGSRKLSLTLTQVMNRFPLQQ